MTDLTLAWVALAVSAFLGLERIWAWSRDKQDARIKELESEMRSFEVVLAKMEVQLDAAIKAIQRIEDAILSPTAPFDWDERGD